MSKGSYSFTTPIYYVNAAPHLGTAYTTVAADTVARYQRMNGYDVAFVTGMDEHGQKVADTAAAHNMTPQAWCDSMEPAFREAWDLLDITYTDFVRTTEPRQARTVQKFWTDLHEKGYLYKGAYEGWYCVHEETYYAESDLEKNEEGQFVCPDCKRPVQLMSSGEENWFFKLSEFQQPLLDFYESNPDFIRPASRRNEIVSFVSRGLKDLSISRSTFDWGIPLPFDEGHVAYVWADALLAYLTGIGYADSPDRPGEFEYDWPMNYHFVGKDIIRFHCVIWPAMLMAAGAARYRVRCSGTVSCSPKARKCRSRRAMGSSRPIWWPFSGWMPIATTSCRMCSSARTAPYPWSVWCRCTTMNWPTPGEICARAC